MFLIWLNLNNLCSLTSLCFLQDVNSSMAVHTNLQGAVLSTSEKGGMRIQYPPTQKHTHLCYISLSSSILWNLSGWSKFLLYLGFWLCNICEFYMLMFLTSAHILKESIWKETRWRCCTSRPNSSTTTEHGNDCRSGIGWRRRSYVAFHTDCCTFTASCSLTCVRTRVSSYFSMNSDVYSHF